MGNRTRHMQRVRRTSAVGGVIAPRLRDRVGGCGACVLTVALALSWSVSAALAAEAAKGASRPATVATTAPAAAAAPAHTGALPKRVLVLNSFGREFAPF